MRKTFRIPHPALRIPKIGTYRHDAARSGSTTTAVPAELGRIWQTEIGGKLSSLVVAGGRVYVTSIDRHTVHALDTDSGKPLWQFTAGGRIDSPPTVWQNRVLFGSADGFVYCLGCADGALAWRFRAAPGDSRLMAEGQFESVWPIHGSVLVRDGMVYCVAGRSMWLDGGLRLLRLDAQTGRMLSETTLDDKYPDTQDNLQRDIKWPNLPVALPDVLSSDERYVYMRSQPFDFEGKRIDVITPRRYGEQRGETAHLFCPTGFLDDSWWHRSYWMYGRCFISGAGGWYLAGYQAPAGRILVMDDATVYGFGRAPLRYGGTPIAYHLFACDRQPELINPNPKQARRRGSSVYGPVVATRLKYHWSHGVPLMVRAMVATDQSLIAVGPPVTVDEMEVYARYSNSEVQARMADQVAAFAGRKGAVLLAVSKTEGKKVAAYRLESAPVFDGLVAAGGRLLLSTLDGNVVCLGGGPGARLREAPNINPGPVPAATAGFVPTKSHPDFQHVATIEIASADLGYRLRTVPREVGLALRKLDVPLTKRAEFRVKVRPNPGAASPDTPGNGFIAFGDGPQDEQLVKCGFRIAGKQLIVTQGPLLNGRSTSKPLHVKANQVAEIHVVMDLGTQRVTASMLGQTVEASLERRLNAVSWVGCCVNSVTSDFGPVKIEGE